MDRRGANNEEARKKIEHAMQKKKGQKEERELQRREKGNRRRHKATRKGDGEGSRVAPGRSHSLGEPG